MERIAIVTGAGSGIGRASALALSEAGFAVVLAGRRADALETSAGSAKGQTLVAPTDVTDEAAVEALFAKAVEKFGRVDVLFNNAGMSAPPVPPDELTLAHWQSVVALNLTGSFLCARAAFRQMKRQDPRGGRIINNGSISAHTPRPHSAPYTATKHAITGLTKALSLDGRAFDIAVGQIDIGNAETELAAIFRRGVPQANGTIAPEALMDVKLVADAVVHMAKLPLDANILSMTIMANAMPFVGRG